MHERNAFAETVKQNFIDTMTSLGINLSMQPLATITQFSGLSLREYQHTVTKAYFLTNETHPNFVNAPTVWGIFAGELIAQWDFMKRSGVKVDFVDEDPTPKGENGKISARLMAKEYADTGVLRIFRSNCDHKFLDAILVDGESCNSIFRAVHDFFGHLASGADFTWKGETTAYYSHAEMFTEAALPALFCESVAQQCAYYVTGDYVEQRMVIMNRSYMYPRLKE